MISEPIEVLVVEDDIDHYRLMKHHIEKVVETPEVSCVDTMEKLKKFLENNKPDLVISDYKMNGFNGLDVLKYVKEKTSITNFIFITSTINDEELAADTILSGASGYILKKHMPVLHTKLKPFIAKIIEDRKFGELPPGHRATIDSMRLFIKSANEYNKVHIASYNEIKDTLDRLGNLNENNDV